MNRQQLINDIIECNLSLCRNDTSVNDGLIYDILYHGFKGLKNMSIEELREELESIEIDN